MAARARSVWPYRNRSRAARFVWDSYHGSFADRWETEQAFLRGAYPTHTARMAQYSVDNPNTAFALPVSLDLSFAASFLRKLVLMSRDAHALNSAAKEEYLRFREARDQA